MHHHERLRRACQRDVQRAQTFDHGMLPHDRRRLDHDDAVELEALRCPRRERLNSGRQLVERGPLRMEERAKRGLEFFEQTVG